MMTINLSAMKGRNMQVANIPMQCLYDKGTQSVIMYAFDNQRIHMRGQFDGVFNDRFTHYLLHEASGDECAEYRLFKQ